MRVALAALLAIWPSLPHGALAAQATVTLAPAIADDSDCPHSAFSHHTMMLRGRHLSYTAHAGFLPIRDGETGETHGCMFYIAYLRDAAKGSGRPVTFLWNGGPGSSSAWLHFEAFGPKRFETSGDPTKLSSRGAPLVDNPDTLLDQTDLVFVDPIGTGFSRATKPAYESEFFNVVGDIASAAEFVRVYRDHFGIWNDRVYLAGESYGSWRVSGAAEILESRGTRVAGAVLISGGIPVETLMAPEMRAALFVPNRTAAAFYHGKLAPDLSQNLEATLGESSKWAENSYGPALMHADNLSAPERDRVLDGLSRRTGMEKSALNKESLILKRKTFVTELVKGKTLGSLDARLTRSEAPDPTRVGMILSYFHEVLRVDDDLPYLGIGDDGYAPTDQARRKSVNERWSYNQGEVKQAAMPASTNARTSPTYIAADAEAHDGPGEHQPWLSRAMRLDPEMKAFVAAGWFDTWNSCLGNKYTVEHLEPALARNITANCYVAGHIIYRDRQAADTLRADLRKFYGAGGAL